MTTNQRRSFLGKMAAASAMPFVPSFLKPEANMNWINEYKQSALFTPKSPIGDLTFSIYDFG